MIWAPIHTESNCSDLVIGTNNIGKFTMQMLDVIKRLLFKNRTIVTSDISECIRIIRENYSVDVLEYPTGAEYQTWQVPPEWNVRYASIASNGQVIASLDDSRLLVAPYSLPFHGSVTKSELVQHVYTNPAKPDSYCYEFRLAYNYQRRLQEWRLSMPHDLLHSLPEGKYEIEIDVEVKDGNMLIGESTHKGQSGYWFTFLAHYCHIAQANDGLAGVAVMLEAVDRIREKYPNSKYGYKALLMPETIGSSIYAATHENELDATVGAVFSEMGGAESPLQLVLSRRGDTYIDRLFLYVLEKQGKLPCRIIPFRKGWGNDELVFDAPGLGVPTVSIDRHPFDAYHTHHDNMELIKLERLEEIVEILLGVVDELERDYIPKLKNRVPVYLTRFNLYSDWTYERSMYDVNVQILDGLWSGLSVTDLALKNQLDVEYVHHYLGLLSKNDLVNRMVISPEYTRTTRF